jgi:hypothetical protein
MCYPIKCVTRSNALPDQMRYSIKCVTRSNALLDQMRYPPKKKYFLFYFFLNAVALIPTHRGWQPLWDGLHPAKQSPEPSLQLVEIRIKDGSNVQRDDL